MISQENQPDSGPTNSLVVKKVRQPHSAKPAMKHLEKALLAASKNPDGVSATDFAKEIDVSVVSAHRYLHALADAGHFTRAKVNTPRGRFLMFQAVQKTSAE